MLASPNKHEEIKKRIVEANFEYISIHQHGISWNNEIAEDSEDTVDGLNPAPPGMYETL